MLDASGIGVIPGQEPLGALHAEARGLRRTGPALGHLNNLGHFLDRDGAEAQHPHVEEHDQEGVDPVSEPGDEAGERPRAGVTELRLEEEVDTTDGIGWDGVGCTDDE